MARRGPAGALLLGLLAVAIGAGGAAASGSGVSRAKLQLMPLPHAALGAAAAKLGLDSGSGWETNEASAQDDLDPALTAARLAKMGRITGFGVEFDDLAHASKRGLLVDASSAVDSFRNAASAAAYLKFEADEFNRFRGKTLKYGFTIDTATFFDVPGLTNARGIQAHVRAGSLNLWETAVEFQVGSLAANVGFARTDETDLRSEVKALAGTLAQRIHGVLAGTVHDKPLPHPVAKLGGLGKPPNGPDPAQMSIQAADVSSARPPFARYVRNSDDVAEYVSEFADVSVGPTSLAYLRADVELRPDVKSATDGLAVLGSLFRGAQGRRYMRQAIVAGVPASVRKTLRVGRLALVKVAAGDEAFAYASKLTLAAVTFDFVICTVRRAQVVETLSVLSAPRATIPRIATTRLARIAVARIDQILHP